MKPRTRRMVAIGCASLIPAFAQPPDPARIEKYQPYLAVKKWIGTISYRQQGNMDYMVGKVRHSATSNAYGDIHFTASFQSHDGITAHWVGEEESSEQAGRSGWRKISGGGVTGEESHDAAGMFRQVSGYVNLDFAEGKYNAERGHSYGAR
jgi:hypothetical protein